MPTDEWFTDRWLSVNSIWLQGGEALTPVLPLGDDCVRYRVPGLVGVELVDYRPIGRRALEAAITEEGAGRFHANFNSFAFVRIREGDPLTTIELRDSSYDVAWSPIDILWTGSYVNKRPPPYWPGWSRIQILPGPFYSFVAALR
jgi:hypothetical protein